MIVPEQRTTINGTGISGDGSSSGTANTSRSISNATIPVAQFTTNAAMGYAPLTVQFLDSSLNIPASWSWNFGDNSYSYLQNPSHTYNAGGVYRVILTTANSAGSSSFSNTISVYVPRFSATPDHGTAPLTVTFAETGSGAVSLQPSAWTWDFGDGSKICTNRTETHTYLLPGNYHVNLRITGPAGATWLNTTAAVTVT